MTEEKKKMTLVSLSTQAELKLQLDSGPAFQDCVELQLRLRVEWWCAPLRSALFCSLLFWEEMLIIHSFIQIRQSMLNKLLWERFILFQLWFQDCHLVYINIFNWMLHVRRQSRLSFDFLCSSSSSYHLISCWQPKRASERTNEPTNERASWVSENTAISHS